MSDQTTIQMTANDLLELSSTNGERYELIEGELIIMPPAGGEHGEIGASLLGYLFIFLQNNPLGKLLIAETGFKTRGDNRTVRAPDVAFIPTAKIPQTGIPKDYLTIVPDLVVEVVSPNDRASEIDAKIQEWLNFGVLLVWVIYPSTRRIYVYRQSERNPTLLTIDDILAGDPALPGFALPVQKIFS